MQVSKLAHYPAASREMVGSAQTEGAAVNRVPASSADVRLQSALSGDHGETFRDIMR